MNEKCSLRVDTMSLKKTTQNEISKKHSKLPQVSTLNNQLFGVSMTTKDGKMKSIFEQARKNKYSQLQFSKKGSSSGSKIYICSRKSTKNREVTVIPDTDTEGEREEINEIPKEKRMAMAKRLQPKVLLTDIINLCSDSGVSDNNS